jgi:molybdopterin converting factor small subunit
MVTIEFLGIARLRAGRAAVQVEAGTLGEALEQVAVRLPHWGDACLSAGQLHPTLMANINGERFVTGLDQPLAAGDCLLILSADAGG